MQIAQITVFPQKGLVPDTREPELRVEIPRLRHQERSATEFMTNIRTIAADLARRSGQVEVMVEWQLPRRPGAVESVPLGRMEPSSVGRPLP